MIQTLQNMARTMLHEVGISAEELWPEAIRTAAYLWNRSPTSALHKMTPYEVWHGLKPSLAHIRPFGCPAYVLVPPKLRKAKFNSRTRRCLLIGYVHDTQKMWRLWDPSRKLIFNSSNVHFAESEISHIGKNHVCVVCVLRL